MGVKRSEDSGDRVGGDKITIHEISGGYVAAGDHAQVTVNYISAKETPGVWVGVPPMPAHFAGREGMVRELSEKVISGQSKALSMVGLPGVGKTTMAAALAHHRKVLEHFKDGVLWAGLGKDARESTLDDILNRWGRALKVDVADEIDLSARKEAIEDAIGQKALLLVIDDVWDLGVAKWLRTGNPHCCHLLTTRDQGIAREFAGANGTMTLPTLDESSSLRLLQDLAPESCAADPQAALDLAKAVGGLPLALALLGGFLAMPEHSILPELSEAALEEMTNPHHRLQLAQERFGSAVRQESLQDTIALSINGLLELENGEEAVQAFYALGAFAPKPERFEWGAAEAVSGVDKRTLAMLVARNLVETSGEQLAIHNVLADVAATKVDQTAVARHRAYYLNRVNEDRDDWQQIEELYGQIKKAWEHVPANEDLLEMVWALRVYQTRRGLWDDHLTWNQRGLDVAREQKWPEDEVSLLINSGWVYSKLGQKRLALKYYDEALFISEEIDDKGNQATALNNLGGIYDALGQYEKALESYRQALTLSEEVADREGESTILTGIGLVYQNQGEYEKALEQYNRALLIAEESDDWEGQAAILSNIGEIYGDWGRPREALEHYYRSLWAREEVGYRAGQSPTLNNIGKAYAKLGELDKALEYFNLVLSIDVETGNRYGQAVTLVNIASVYSDLYQQEEADKKYREALSIAENIEDRDGSALALMGDIYEAFGDLEKALDRYKRALSIMKETGDRYGRLDTSIRIGSIYDDMGRWEDALAYYNEALSISQEIGNRNSEATILNNLGVVLARKGEAAEALESYLQALHLREEIGDKRQATLLNNIGDVYGDLNRRKKAMKYFRRAFSRAKEEGDQDGMATALTYMGGMYEDVGNDRKASTSYKRALSIWKKMGNRRQEAITLNHIGRIHNYLGHPRKAITCYKKALKIADEIGDEEGLPILLFNIGNVYDDRGKPNKALRYYEKSLALRDEASERAVVLYYMAMIYREQGELEEAARALRQVVALDETVDIPDEESVINVLEDVEKELAKLKKRKQ